MSVSMPHLEAGPRQGRLSALVDRLEGVTESGSICHKDS